MKILIIGFQRSGTTLLRRLITMHPDIRQILHENFLLINYNDKESVRQYLVARNTDMDKQNWGDKTPYYPNIRKIPVSKYCEKWINMFGKDQSRIIHIFRHPYDIAFSVDNKYKNQTFRKAFSLYKKSIKKALDETIDMPEVMSFKYEDLILNHDVIVPSIYKFCNINHKIDYKKLMDKWENSKYQSFDKSRVFAYKNKNVPVVKDSIKDLLDYLNEKLGGPKYEMN